MLFKSQSDYLQKQTHIQQIRFMTINNKINALSLNYPTFAE